MNLLLFIMAAAGATYIANPRTTLTAEEALDLGIRVSALNFEYEIMDAPSPLFLQLDLSGFKACQVRDVGIDAMNESGQLVFGSSIAESNSQAVYPFRLERDYLNYTRMAIVCSSGPTVLDYVYMFNLGEVVQASRQ